MPGLSVDTPDHLPDVLLCSVYRDVRSCTGREEADPLSDGGQEGQGVLCSVYRYGLMSIERARSRGLAMPG